MWPTFRMSFMRSRGADSVKKLINPLKKMQRVARVNKMVQALKMEIEARKTLKLR